MTNKKVLSLLTKVSFVLVTSIILTACGESSYSDYDSSKTSSSSYSSSDYNEDDSDYSNYNSSTYNDSGSSSSYSSSSSDNYSSSYDTNDYSSSSNDYSEGHSYDKSDPFYSANDVDGDGKLTDEEWQNAMDDAITYYYYKMQEEN